MRELIERLSAYYKRSPATVGDWITGDGTFYRRLAAGAGARPKRAEQVLQWCSDRWPDDLSWPAGVERPAPNPAALWEQPSPAPVAIAAARRARERLWDLMFSNNPNEAAINAAETVALRIGMRLDPRTKQVACPDALCAAVGAERRVYDGVVARYTKGRFPIPRRRSKAREIWTALRASGDVRFQ